MPDEPVTFVVERHHGREKPSVIVGPLPDWLTAKGTDRLVYSLRLDRIENGAALAKRPVSHLYALFVQLRKADKLPPPNSADPPRKDVGDKGVLRGKGSWWTPPPRLWDDFPPDPRQPPSLEPRYDAPAYIGHGKEGDT